MALLYRAPLSVFTPFAQAVLILTSVGQAAATPATDAESLRPSPPLLSTRLRLLYCNYSGADAFLSEGPVAADENLSGDGVGVDIWTEQLGLDLGVTASSVFILNRDPSYLGGAFVGKSIRSSDWRLSFDTGFGGLTLIDSSDPMREQRKFRPATLLAGQLDYFISETFSIGLQVQSWVALGPEGDLGASSGSLAIAYDLL